MNELIEFLNTDEVHIVCMVALAICILGTLYFMLEKKLQSKKQKRNTKELNELVEKLDEEENKVDKPIMEEVIEPVINIEQVKKVDVKPPMVIPVEEFKENQRQEAEVNVNNNIVKEKQNDTVTDIYKKVKDEIETLEIEEEKDDSLQYTNAVPNEEEAKEELRKATIELIKSQEEPKNIELTEFEQEQEKNAIISVDELMKKGNNLYEQNEITQYEDEGNEPISLQDLEKRMDNIKKEVVALESEEPYQQIRTPEKPQILNVEEPKIKLDDFYTAKPSKAYQDDHVFKSSPIISPIFGIEKQSKETNLELENTANYDKLDEEIKKTNEFLGKLRELQKNLD